MFGAGYYTFHHWRLAATSRGLLAIALLLTPLNLLLLADPGARGTTDWLDIVVKVTAVDRVRRPWCGPAAATSWGPTS